MRLTELTLKNFQGIESFSIAPKGKNVSIYGENGRGKTTIANSITWLLFGKDSHGNADFEIKTIVDGQPVHNLEHSVKASFKLDDGIMIELEKVYREKWTTARGSSTKELTGHTTDHFANGVPVKQKEYQERVAEIATEEKFKLLTQPLFFSETMMGKPGKPAWMLRREILLSICDYSPSDKDVVESNTDLKPLLDIPEIVAGRSMDDHRKTVSGRKSEINKKLEHIPVKVQENERDKQDVSGIDHDVVDQEIIDISTDIDSISETIKHLEGEGVSGELEKKLADADVEISKAQTDFNNREGEAVRELRKQQSESDKEINRINSEITSIKEKINTKSGAVISNKKEMDILRQKISDLGKQKKEFEPVPGYTCDRCTQTVSESVQKSINTERLIEESNILNDKGLALKTANEKLESEIAELEKSLAETEKTLDPATKNGEELAEAISNRPSIDSDPAYSKAVDHKNKIAADIEKAKSGKSSGTIEALEEAKKERANLAEKLKTKNKLIDRFVTNERVQKRTEELRSEQKTLAAELEKIESELFLVEEFVRTKCRMLEESVNGMFKLAKFRLFRTQINGGIDDCCDVLGENGVPYSSGLNSGQRINIGIDIINTMSEHYGITLPIIIDNSESICVLEETQAQVIRLVVLAEDKELRVEVK